MMKKMKSKTTINKKDVNQSFVPSLNNIISNNINLYSKKDIVLDKKKVKYYFSKSVQEKIVEYQNVVDVNEKEILYEKHVHPAFTNLVNSLVAVYNFKSSNEEIEHLKHDCVVFLFENIHKWNPDKGTKAFSYFNVVAKNWLTIQSRRLLKHAKRSAFIEDDDGLTAQEKEELFDINIEDESFFEEDYEKIHFEFNNDIINFIFDSLKEERDKKCCLAIKKLHESLDDLEYHNKRAMFVYLREISGLSSTELSMSLSNIRKIYRKNVGLNKKFDLQTILEQ